MAAPLSIGTMGTRRPLTPTASANSGVASPASSAAFASLNLGADQARGPGTAPPPSAAPPAPSQATPATAAPAAPAAAPYSPSTNLTPGQDKNYNDWFANNDQTGQQIQNLAQQQAAQGNRKAAYLASMSGGNGGFYQSGQIAAGIAGQNMMQQGLLQNAQARGQIYGDKAAALGSLGIGAQNFGNQMGLATEGERLTMLGQRIKDGHPNWHPGTDAWNDYADLENAVTQALGNYQNNNPTGGNPMSDPAVAAAFSALQNFNIGGYSDAGAKTSGTYADAANNRLNTLRGR